MTDQLFAVWAFKNIYGWRITSYTSDPLVYTKPKSPVGRLLKHVVLPAGKSPK